MDERFDWAKGLIASMHGDNCAFDQSCKFGFRVGGHSVYCENENMPCRKCRRTWFTGGEVKDEDCRGFERNDLSTGGNT